MKNGNLIADLKSGNTEIVLQSIQEIRETGNASHFSALMDLLHQTRIKEIKEKILELFSELKSTETIPLLINAIQNSKNKLILEELVSCCWQNGMNYSAYLPVFVDLIINEDFIIGFEAFTVIENMFGNIDPEIINQQIIKVEQVDTTADEKKNFLLKSLPTALRSIPEENREL